MIHELFNNRPKSRHINPLPKNPEKGGRGRFPSWLRRSLPTGSALFETSKILEKNALNTVCEQAKCPNRWECYSHHTATFLALGKACTRACGFCDISFSKHPAPPDEDEPQRIAQSVLELGLKHVVSTMVAREELEDRGAGHIAAIIRSIKDKGTTEVLTSDFSGNQAALDAIAHARPDIFNHNIETVRRLTPRIRHKATYDRTLSVLAYIKGKVPLLKSGMMVGLGEHPEEVEQTIGDLFAVGVDIITIGQYLQPNRGKLLVKSFVSPQQFRAYEDYGYRLGVPYMYAGPFVRSSYNAKMLKDRMLHLGK